MPAELGAIRSAAGRVAPPAFSTNDLDRRVEHIAAFELLQQSAQPETSQAHDTGVQARPRRELEHPLVWPGALDQLENVERLAGRHLTLQSQGSQEPSQDRFAAERDPLAGCVEARTVETHADASRRAAVQRRDSLCAAGTQLLDPSLGDAQLGAALDRRLGLDALHMVEQRSGRSVERGSWGNPAAHALRSRPRLLDEAVGKLERREIALAQARHRQLRARCPLLEEGQCIVERTFEERRDSGERAKITLHAAPWVEPMGERETEVAVAPRPSVITRA